MNKKKQVENLINWIDKSGIQDKNGGVYSWWDLKKNKYAFFYSEITGYYITLNLYLYKIYKTKNFLLNAEKAADWIERNALLESGAILTRKYLDEENDNFSFEGKNIFFWTKLRVIPERGLALPSCTCTCIYTCIS